MNSETENKPVMDGEQAADFAALQAAANEGAAVGPVAEGAQPGAAVQGPSLEQEIAGMLKMVSGMVKPALPSVAALYTPEVCDGVGAAVAAVCNKHGWLQGGIGGKYGEEIMCLCLVGPIAWATVEAAKTDIDARKAAKAKPITDGGAPAQAAAASDPGGNGKKVTFG